MADRDHLTLSRSQARRFLLEYQGLWSPRHLDGKPGIIVYFSRVGCIQFDPLNIIGRNPDLVLQSRVKDYRPELLEELLYQDRLLLDGYDKVMSIYRVEDWPYFERFREAGRKAMLNRTDGIQSVLPQVRAEVENRGPLSSIDLDFNHTVDWSWAPTRASRAALESLYFAGELIVHHKINTRKVYDFAHRHIPAGILQAADPNRSEAQYQDWHVLRRIGSVGLLWNRSGEAWLGLQGVKSPQRNRSIQRLIADGLLIEAQVEGIDIPFYLRSQDLPILEEAINSKQTPRNASIIAPLDNLLWERRLVEEIFDFEYRWEVYTPKAKRQYGYYVLPVLYGDRFIARFEPVLDKKTRVLKIENWWWEPGVMIDAEVVSALEESLRSFIHYLNATRIQIKDVSLHPDEIEALVKML